MSQAVWYRAGMVNRFQFTLLEHCWEFWGPISNQWEIVPWDKMVFARMGELLCVWPYACHSWKCWRRASFGVTQIWILIIAQPLTESPWANNFTSEFQFIHGENTVYFGRLFLKKWNNNPDSQEQSNYLKLLALLLVSLRHSAENTKKKPQP